MGAKETWRRVGPSRVAPDGAIANGLRLLETATPHDPPTLAWWQVDRPALVLGRGNTVTVDEAARAATGVPVVRRASGGGPVLWSPDLLALDLVVPRGHRLHTDDVVEAYRWAGTVLAHALDSIGLAVELVSPARARAENDPELAALACFAGLSPWEVLVGERKIVGLSQVRRRQGSLIQAGIVLGPGGAALASLLVVAPSARATLAEALDVPGPALAARDVIAATEDAVARLEDVELAA